VSLGAAGVTPTLRPLDRGQGIVMESAKKAS